MKYLLVALLILLSQAVSSQMTIDQGKKQELDSIFYEWKSNNKPGGIISVISQGEIIYNETFGVSNIKKGTPFTNTTPFNMASVAKQFTGMCIALLEEQNKLDIQDDIKNYFPELKYSNKITIKNLLDHSSGIREPTVIAVLSRKGIHFSEQLPRKQMNNEYLTNVVEKEVDLNFPTGTEKAYSNVNYMLLASIVEKVSGQPFPEFADSAIFKPLGMHNSYFVNHEENGSEIIGYHYDGKKFKKSPIKSDVVGDGNLISTMEDMYLWDQNFFNNQLGIKKDNLIEKIYTSTSLINGNSTHYNYGLNISEFNGLRLIYHGGQDEQHTSVIMRLPEQKFSIIIMANSSGVDYPDPEGKAFEIINLLFSMQKEALKYSESSLELQKVPEESITKRKGLYYRLTSEGLANIRQIDLKEGKLTVSTDLSNLFSFNSVNENHYITRNGRGDTVHIRFEEQNQSNILKEGFWMYDEDWEFTRRKSNTYNPQEYSGTYTESNHDTSIRIKARKNKIIARKSLFKIPLIMLDKDLFFSPEHSAVFIFHRDENGKVKRLQLNSNDFRNFNFSKKN